jgi:hypothetical protein
MVTDAASALKVVLQVRKVVAGQAMKASTGLEVQLHSCLNSALNEDEWPTLQAERFTPGEMTESPSEAGLPPELVYILWRSISYSFREMNHYSSFVQTVAYSLRQLCYRGSTPLDNVSILVNDEREGN